MVGVLKEIEVDKHCSFFPKHFVKMFFSKSMGSDELYCFVTTLEDQFCTKEEKDKKFSDEFLNEKEKFAKTFVGKRFVINLFTFSIKELTDNRYVAIYDNKRKKRIESVNRATYREKEDEKMHLKFGLTSNGINGYCYGILVNGSTEEITTDFLFPSSVPSCKKELMKKYTSIDVDKQEFKERKKAFLMAQRMKYKGKKVIKLFDEE